MATVAAPGLFRPFKLVRADAWRLHWPPRTRRPPGLLSLTHMYGPAARCKWIMLFWQADSHGARVKWVFSRRSQVPQSAGAVNGGKTPACTMSRLFSRQE